MKALLDIETRKVPTPDGFALDSGEPMRRRWRPFLIGVAIGEATYLLAEQDEQEMSEAILLDELTELLDSYGVDEVVYAAGRRDFDEMVLRGRFSNARRPYLTEPGPWPNVDGLGVVWSNLGGIDMGDRSDDLPSADVPGAWARGDRAKVRSHLLADLEALRSAVE